VNGRSLPKVEITDFVTKFDSSKIHLELYGSFIADIVDGFTWIFKSSVISSIQDSINDNIPPTVNAAV
jgi:hypothetical protein